MEEYAVCASENADYLDEATGKRIYFRFLVGGKFILKFSVMGRNMQIRVIWL